MTTELDNSRNPTKKRGRPPKSLNRQGMAERIGTSRNSIDMFSAAKRGLAPGLWDEWLPKTNTGETTVTIMGYVSRLPHEMQPEMFKVFNTMGSRWAKRFVECMENPPAAEKVAQSLRRWIGREYPGVDEAVLSDACRLVAYEIEQEAEGK